MTSLSPTNAGGCGRSTLSRNLVRFAVVALSSLFLLVLAMPAFAQEATIVGTVTDPSGAAVADAKVTLTNVGGVTTSETSMMIQVAVKLAP